MIKGSISSGDLSTFLGNEGYLLTQLSAFVTFSTTKKAYAVLERYKRRKSVIGMPEVQRVSEDSISKGQEQPLKQ